MAWEAQPAFTFGAEKKEAELGGPPGGTAKGAAGAVSIEVATVTRSSNQQRYYDRNGRSRLPLKWARTFYRKRQIQGVPAEQRGALTLHRVFEAARARCSKLSVSNYEHLAPG
jgi:hypothetical protein